MIDIFEIVGLLALCTVKFLFIPSTTIALGYTFWQTVLISITGGWLGVLIFYYSGKFIFDLWSKIIKPSNKVFTKKNRFVVWLKNGFGLTGLALIIGVASIPIISLLAAKYYSNNSKTIVFLFSSIVIWAFFLSALSIWIIPKIKVAFF